MLVLGNFFELSFLIFVVHKTTKVCCVSAFRVLGCCCCCCCYVTRKCSNVSHFRQVGVDNRRGDGGLVEGVRNGNYQSGDRKKEVAWRKGSSVDVN